MAQYISVYLDNEETYYKNKGLYEIIKYIGREQYKKKSSLSSKEAYKLGKKHINSQLRKWNITAIDNLVSADKQKYKFDYDQKTIKPVWKIHRNKAKKIFKAISKILNRCDDSEIHLLFDRVCRDFGFSTGAEVAGSPYYRIIKSEKLLEAQNLNDTDIKSLKDCADKIEDFSKFH